MIAHTKMHWQMLKLLERERVLEIGRLAIQPVEFVRFKGKLILKLDPGSAVRIRQFDLQNAIFEVYKTGSNMGGELRICEWDGQLQMFWFKGFKPSEQYQYTIVPKNPTIAKEIQNLRKMHQMDYEIFNFIKNPTNSPIGYFGIPYHQQQLDGLNDPQKQSVRMAMQNKICLIKGPPGTGKTLTISKIVQLLSRQEFGFSILVCGPSNVAVDTTTRSLLKFIKYPERITRFCSQRAARRTSQQLVCVNFPDKVLKCVKDNCDPQFYVFFQENLHRSMDKKELVEMKNFTVKDFYEVRTNMYNYVLQNTQIMCTTMITSGSGILSGFCPNIVIADQASQSIQAELIVSLNKGAGKVILFGDELQLPPTVISNNLKLKTSLFKRIFEARPDLSIMLNIQYRMHPILSQFASNEFYGGQIKDGVVAKDLESEYELFRRCPIVLFDCKTQESKRETSYYNTEEVEVIKKIVRMFKQEDLKRIGIITGFTPQSELLIKELKFQMDKGLEIKTFDGYQGNEKDYVIISFVRSNPAKAIGFLEQASRANVALTRARKGIIIVGNMDTIQSDNNYNYNPWKNFIKYAASLGVQPLVFDSYKAQLHSQKFEVREPQPIHAPVQVPKPKQNPSAIIKNAPKQNPVVIQKAPQQNPVIKQNAPKQNHQTVVQKQIPKPAIKIELPEPAIVQQILSPKYKDKKGQKNETDQDSHIPNKRRKKMKGEVVNIYQL